MESEGGVKIVLLGRKAVGKTSLFNRYVHNVFGKTHMTLGGYFASHDVELRGRRYTLAIWDTAGEEQFNGMTRFYTRNARAAVVCYDICSLDSFQAAKDWAGTVLGDDPAPVVVFVGTKLDIVEASPDARQVSLAHAQEHATSVGGLVVECSSKTGAFVSEVFVSALQAYLRKDPTAGAGDPKSQSSVYLSPVPTRRSQAAKAAAGRKPLKGQQQDSLCCF